MMQYRFLIYISYSYAIPIGKPLEAEIKKRGYEVFWFSSEKDGDRSIQKTSKKFNNIKDALAYDPHIILTISDTVPDFFKGLKVQAFHGFNAEKRNFNKDHFRIRGFFDLYCTQGPSTTSVFKKQQKKYKTFEVIETGWSKVDPLFPILKTEINRVPTIFIASTFTERLSLAYNDSILEEVKRLSESGTFRFLMVLHPKIPEDVILKWKSIENENFKYFDTTDLVPLMREADAMFSDTTSAIQEFGLQDKLTVTFNHFVPKDFLINVRDVKEIEAALTIALSRPKGYLDRLKNFNNALHPYTDGESSARVINASIDFLHTDKTYFRQKPLNLVRKYKLRKRLGYFSSKSFSKPLTLPKK